MEAAILGYAIEFLIRTVFLSVALWIMLKLQDLNYNYPGLLGTAALAGAMNMLLQHHIGGYGSGTAVTLLLYFCVWKLTQAEFIDVKFTVIVGGALVFCMNLFLIGWLMGDLRLSAREKEPAIGDHGTNGATAAFLTAIDPSKAAADRTKTNFISGAAPARRPVPAATREPVHPAQDSIANAPSGIGKIAKAFSVKGVTENASNSTAMIYSGVKIYTIGVGETMPMQTAGGAVAVRCDSISGNAVVLDVAGEKIPLSLH